MEARNFYNVVGIFIVVIIFFGNVLAQQEVKNPGRGFQSGASYSISDIENINTTNGNLMLNIPLVNLPKGRGEVGQSISLTYNSKLFDTSVEELPNLSGQLADQNMLVGGYDGGWKYSINTYELLVSNRSQNAPLRPCDGSAGDPGINSFIWKVEMRMPDGSKREFRPYGYNDSYNDGFFGINANGYEARGCSIPSTTLVTSGDMTYYSTDGSYTRLVVNHSGDGTNNGSFNTWTMSMPDGSRVTGGGNSTRLYDRNGNYLDGTTDIFGRSISIQYNTNTNEDQVIMRGVGNEELRWTIKWKTITTQKTYTTTGANSGRQRGGTSNQTYSRNYRVVDRITLPPQAGSLYYEFNYNCEPGGVNGWGEISKVRMPSGATADYKFTTPGPANTTNVLKNYPSKKTLSYLDEYDGVSSTHTPEVTTYTINSSGSSITNPDGSGTSESHGDTSYENLMSGLVGRIANSNGNLTERSWAFNRPPGGNTSENINAYVKTEYTTIADASGNPSITSIKDYTVDPNGNRVEVLEYDWVAFSAVNALPKDGLGTPIGIPSGAVLKRKTISTFNNSATTDSTKGYWSATAPNVRNAASSVEIRDGNSNLASRTELYYDLPGTTANLTQAKLWDSVTGGYVTTSTAYDPYGNPTLLTDANGNQTQITFGSVGGYTGLYPTQTVTAYQTAVARTSTAAYDFYTGLVTSATDNDNSNATTSTSYDALGRPVTVIAPDGAKTTTQYYDAQRFVVVKSDINTTGDGKKVATQFYDQLGRVRLSKTLEDASTQSATNETDGIKVQTRYMISGGYTYQLKSNPYRASYSSSETDPTMGWTRTKAVNTGKQSQAETFSGASLPAPWGSNTSSTGIASTDLDANRTLVTDQAGKQRISKTNGLGQLTYVWEIKAFDASTVSVTFPGTSVAYGYQTSYVYDTLNNLTTVNQGSQTRSFTYGSLSRLTSAANPESGTINYVYDSNGNLTRKTDARNIQTNYVYDALNRITQRSYTDGVTPLVSYTYDNLPNAKGRLTKVNSSVSTTEYTAFDILGRVTGHKQTTDGTAYTTGYTYKLNGALDEETYPSGRVVKNVLNNNGDLAIVQSKKNASSGFFNYAKSFTYAASGAITSMQLGNGKWESTTFNNRLQPEQIALGLTQGATNLLKLNYSYGTSNNNGNVLSQTITVPGLAQPFVQNYSYDELNRLSAATETNNGSSTWNQIYGYDRYGNRNVTSGTGVTSFSFSGNRITAHSYDSAGNTTGDGTRTFTYDAENKQTAVNNGSTGQYSYDGDGKRVKKYVQGTGETTVFVYDAAGKQLAEYSTIVYTGTDAKVAYVTNDHLGSPRINTDANGAVTSRHDYHPFGEEIFTSQRTTALNYSADTVRKQFTTYERDNETDLDFAQARYYSKNLGRFNSPDEPFSDQSEDDPQSWNLYSYVRNAPTIFIDNNGRWRTVDCKDNSVGGAKCIESDRDDDSYKTLAAFLNVGNVGDLANWFNNQKIVNGETVFEVSGFMSKMRLPNDPGGELVGMELFMAVEGGGRGLWSLITGGAKAAGRGIASLFAKEATSVVETTAPSVIPKMTVSQLSEKIAKHSFGKHILRQGEFGGLIKTSQEMAKLAEKVLTNPTATKVLSNGRVAFWDESSKSVIIYNSLNPARSTMFQPPGGISYFLNNLR